MKMKIIVILVLVFSFCEGVHASSTEQIVLKNGLVFDGQIVKQTLGKDITFSIEQTEASVNADWATVSRLKRYEDEELPLEWKNWLKYKSKYSSKEGMTAKLSLGWIELHNIESMRKDRDMWKSDSAKMIMLLSILNNDTRNVLFLEEGDRYRFVDKGTSTHTFSLNDIQSIRYQLRDPMEMNGIIDVIGTNNGTYRGQIVEKIVGKYVKIKTEDGIIRNIRSKEIVFQKKECLNPSFSIIEQTPTLDIIEGERGLVIEHFSKKVDSYITFRSENNFDKRFELKDVKYIGTVENPNYKSQTDIQIKGDSVFLNRKHVLSIIPQKEKNKVYVIPDSVINKEREIEIESYPQELVVEMADIERNKNVIFFPVPQKAKMFFYSYEDMVNKQVHVSNQVVTPNKTLRRTYKVGHGIYVLYNPQTEKTYICKIK